MRQKLALLVGGLVFVLVGLFAVFAVVYITGNPINITAPSDDKLLTKFQNHRAAFEKIRLMAAQDMQHGWYLGLSEASKIDESRRHEYERQISEIQSGIGVTMDGYDTGVRFIFSGGSRLVAIGAGWAKGIEYIPADYGKQGILTTNLDLARKMPSETYLRQIDTNWFIFYQRTD